MIMGLSFQNITAEKIHSDSFPVLGINILLWLLLTFEKEAHYIFMDIERRKIQMKEASKRQEERRKLKESEDFDRFMEEARKRAEARS
jgi:hypothetical protein